METLGEDLLLLAVRPSGALNVPDKLRFGVAGSELVRLAAARRVDVVRGQIVVLDQAPTGDVMLDAALASMAGERRPPAAKAWVARSRPGLVERYLDRLAAAGTIRAERRRLLGLIPVTRWFVTDTARLAAARARLDAIASGAEPLDSAQVAYAGLASAIGLTALLYPGRPGAAARKRLNDAAKREPVADAVAGAASAGAPDAATRAAMDASAAAIAASVSAATQAATAAVHHAAGHEGAHGAGHAGGHDSGAGHHH